jgi:hypothetical protein
MNLSSLLASLRRSSFATSPITRLAGVFLVKSTPRLGVKMKPVHEGRRACALLPISKDAVVGASLITNLAAVYAWTGEKDLALERLALSARIPAGVSHGELKLYAQWKPLCGDPRFEKIVASLAPKR